jgi:hypothetical protein
MSRRPRRHIVVTRWSRRPGMTSASRAWKPAGCCSARSLLEPELRSIRTRN